MEHPGAAGSGEVEACRGGDVVEAEAEAILNKVAPNSLLIACIYSWKGYKVAAFSRCGR